MIYRGKSVAIRGIGSSLKERFSNVPELSTYAEVIVSNETKAFEAWDQRLKDLRKEIASGGAVCEYEWSDGKTRETGILVLKSGEVVKRDAWLTEFLSER